MREAPYYESRYIRANHPERPLALWLRETLLLPAAGDAVADVWVMIFDRGPNRRAQPVLAQDVGGLPDLLDGFPATREQRVSGVETVAQLVEFLLLVPVTQPEHHQRHRFYRGEGREHVSRNLRTDHPSSIGC